MSGFGFLAAGIDMMNSSINNSVTNSMNAKAVRETNQTNYRMNQQNNVANRQLAEKMNEWNIQQWERENAYNTPLAQARRLRQAGLSSAAAAQAIEGAGNASPLQSADLANQQAPPPMQAPQYSFDFPSVLGLMREVEQFKKEQQEAKQSEYKTQQEAENTKWFPTFLLTKYDAERANIDLKRQEYLNIYRSFPYSLRALRYKADADSRLPALRDLELKNARANYESAEINVKLARQQFGFLEKMNDKQIEKMTAEIRNVLKEGAVLDSQAALNRSSADLNKAQKENVEASTSKVKAEKQGVDLENRAKKVAAILAENGQPESAAQRVGVLLANGVISLNTLDKSLTGTKDYVEHGYNFFGPSPYARDFLYYVFDEGSANASKLGLHTLGGYREVHDAIPWFKDLAPK